MIDIFLIALGIVLLILGLIGCIVPFLPGPPLSYIALLMLQLRTESPFSAWFLIIMALIVIAITVIDYIVPVWGTKKIGGTKYGMWGSTIGLILGLFIFPPWGIIIGPFLGAFVGEIINNQNTNKALKSALGSFLGFVAGTLLKLVTSIVITYYFIVNII